MIRKSSLVILTDWNFETFQGIWSHKVGKGAGIVKTDMASEKNMKIEEIKKRQQEMQENIF